MVIKIFLVLHNQVINLYVYMYDNIFNTLNVYIKFNDYSL